MGRMSILYAPNDPVRSSLAHLPLAEPAQLTTRLRMRIDGPVPIRLFPANFTILPPRLGLWRVSVLSSGWAVELRGGKSFVPRENLVACGLGP